MFRGFRRNHLLARRRRARRELDQGGLAEDPAIDERRGAAGEAQRRHRDAMAKGDRHDVDVAPFRREMRRGGLRYFDLGGAQQPDPSEELALSLPAGGHRHLGRADIRGIHQNFGDVQHPVFAMIIADRETPDVDVVARVIGAGKG